MYLLAAICCLAFLANLLTPNLSLAASCDDYPYTDGITVEDVPGFSMPKILSTASSSVTFDDISAVKDARDEALLEAKATIAKFLNEGIKSDETITKAVNQSVHMQGQEKQTVRKEVTDKIKRLQSSSQALLRGVVPLGDCYTKGKELRVTVGLKPETLQQAGNLATGIKKSFSGNPTPSASGNTQEKSGSTTNRSNEPTAGAPSQPLNEVDGFSNTERLKKF